MNTGVAITVKDSDYILLGKSVSDDHRKDKWVFPGGNMEDGESVARTSERECYEETGIVCQAMSDVFSVHPDLPAVGFTLCVYLAGEIKVDTQEFSDVQWFDIEELPIDEMLESNVDLLIHLDVLSYEDVDDFDEDTTTANIPYDKTLTDLPDKEDDDEPARIDYDKRLKAMKKRRDPDNIEK